MPGSTTALIVAGLILVFAIIHLGVGIGITARYNKYNDVFRQSVGLAIFSIIVGLFGIAVGVISLLTVIRQISRFSKIAAICSLVLGVFAFASLIAALALNGQAIGYIRGRLTYRIDSYNSIDSSITIVDSIQTNYQCCGEYLWLDWASIALGATTGTGISTGTGTGTGTSSGTGTITGRRRRYLPLELSPLVQAVRQRRQVTSGTSSTGVYGLPSSYSINLPLSCCKGGEGGGVSSVAGNSIGGYCLFNAGNSTNNFYVGGCIVPVANVVVSQITGIAVINVCLTILAFVFIPILMRAVPFPDDSNGKQPGTDEMQQQQQQQQQDPNGGYYMTNTDPNAYYTYPAAPMNTVPTYAGPVYTTYQ